MLLPAGREAPMTVTCSERVIFNICTYLQNTHRSLEDGVLLGDSGYASSPFLMTSYTTTRNEAQEAYNNAHAKTRVIIEQTFGRWKRRFHVIAW